MIKKKIFIGIIGVLCFTTFTACSGKNISNREVIDKGNKEITILGKNEAAASSELTLDKINNLKDIRALDWIDENTLLVMKDNEKYPKIQLDSIKAYPKNLYKYDINTQKFELIAGSETDMGYAVLSTDKKYVFYKEGIETNLTGFILNLATGKKVQVTHLDSISSTEGRWIDNNTVIFSEFPIGGIYTADINGNVKPIENQPKGMISNAVKLSDKVFYTTVDGKLYVQNIDGKENKFLKDNIIWLIPSPDTKNLVMVKRTEQTKMALVTADVEGKEKKTLFEGTQIFGTNWSPDGTKVAYSAAVDNSGKAGVFISDVNTGKTTQLTVAEDLAANELRWSQDGKKILVTNVTRENNEVHFITNILQLK